MRSDARPPGLERFEGGAVVRAGEFRAPLITLDQSFAYFLIIRLGGDGKQSQQKQKPDHSTSAARFSRSDAAKSRIACARATRSSTLRMMVGTAIASMPSERTFST